MPLVYQQNINPHTKLAVWHITEPESFFTNAVPLQREITHPHKRLQHLAGRFLLREMYPGFPYELIKIADTRKPFLENEAYHFSISHCGEYAAVMVSTQYRVGVDIEKITGKVEKIKHKFLPAFEQNIIESLAGDDAELYKTFLTAAWSIKESLFKWYGDGQVDFIDHLHIKKMETDLNEGTAYCRVLKATQTDLKVNFLFFNNNCLAWVLN
jgi:phosphopantetheinyl transferase